MNFYAPPMAVLFFFYLKSGWICAIIKRKKKSFWKGDAPHDALCCV